MTTELAARLADLRPDGPDEMGRELAEGPVAVEATLAVVERLRPQLEEARRTASRLLLVGTGASLAMAQAAAPLFRAAVSAAGLALARAAHAWAVGFGSAAGLARGATLLLHEKTLLVTVSGTPSEFRHGPIEAAGPADAVVLVETDPPDPRRAAYLTRLAGELAELGVPLVTVGRGPLPPGPLTIPIPEPPAAGAVLLHTLLRIQQLARLAAHARGTYRDGFRVLRTVVGAARDLA